MKRAVIPSLLCAALLAALAPAMAQEAPAPAPEAAPAPAPAPEAAPAPAPAAEAAPAPAPEAPPAPETPPVPLKDIRQVQVQAWISHVSDEGLRTLGTNLNYTRYRRRPASEGGIEERNDSLERVRTDTVDIGRFAVTLPRPDANLYPDNVRQTPEAVTPWTPAGNVPDGENVDTYRGAGLTFDIIEADHGTIEGTFRGLETDADTDLISKPELLVTNGKAAQIDAGDDIPYQQVKYGSNGDPYLNIIWEPLGVKLDITPTIVDERMIALDITNAEISDLVRTELVNNLTMPVFAKRSQQGRVLVPNGSTLVIGGLNSTFERSTETRVPVVGKLPVFGVLFRGRDVESLNTHLVVLVSPTAIDLREMTPPMESALQFWREEQWRHSEKIDEQESLMGVGL